MKRFSTLLFKKQEFDLYSGHLEEDVTLRALIPGVNSGAYSKALHISMHVIRPFKFNSWIKWKFGSKQVMHGKINLNPAEMTQLRDEINKILELER
jgi:hypothetical protein